MSSIPNTAFQHQQPLLPCPTIHRLPPELLRMAFIECLRQTNVVSLSISSVPLVISWVCRHWRNVALDFPELWAKVDIVKALGAIGSAEAFVSLLNIWLERSGNFPLTFKMQDDFHNVAWQNVSGTSEGHGVASVRALQALAPHSKRLKTFQFSGTIYDSDSTRASLIPFKMPLLEELRFRSIILTAPFRPTSTVNLRGCPLLKKLEIVIRQKIHVILDREPYQFLAHVTLQSPSSLDTIISFLRVCPHLEVLNAHAVRGGAPKKTLPLKMERLRKFSIAFDCQQIFGQEVRRFFDSLTFPALTECGIVCDLDTIGVDHDLPINLPGNDELGLANFMERSGARVTSAAFGGLALPAGELLDCLRRCPHLERLALHSINAAPTGEIDIISELTFMEDGGATFVCPRLKTMEFTDWDIGHLANRVALMITSRWKGRENDAEHLQEVTLEDTGLSTMTDMESIMTCVNEGLRLNAFDHPLYNNAWEFTFESPPMPLF